MPASPPRAATSASWRQGALNQAASGDIATSGTGTIDVQAASIAMSDGATASTGSGNIRYAATGTLQLGYLSAAGDVSLLASDIIDAEAGDSDNVFADELRIVTTGTAAGQGAGTGTNHLEINVGRLAADIAGTGTGGLFLSETDNITIGQLNAINVNLVKVDGTVTGSASNDTALSDLASAGRLVLLTRNGMITLEEGDDDASGIVAAGNILLQTGETDLLLLEQTSDLLLAANISSSTGNISLLAARDIRLNADVETATAGRTIDLLSGNDIRMDDPVNSLGDNGTQVLTVDGNIRVEAGNFLLLSQLNAGSGDVSLTAAGIADAGDDSASNIVANALRIAADSFGTAADALETRVNRLAASITTDNADGGLFLDNSQSLTLDSVTAQTVQRVDSTGASSDRSDAAALSDLVASAAGNLILQVVGNLTLNDGDADGSAVNTLGAGNLLLAASGALALNASVIGNGGHLTLLGDAGIDLAAGTQVVANSAGNVWLAATAADIVMVDGANIVAANGNMTLQAGRDILLGGVESTAGHVYLKAGRDILDNGDSDIDVSAQALLLESGRHAGESSNLLDLAIDSLAGRIGTPLVSGNLHLRNAGDLDLVDTAFAIQQVASDATSSAGNTPATPGLEVNSGNLVLIVDAAGAEAGTLRVGQDLIASNAGHVRLDAAGDLVLDADIDAGEGHLSLLAGADFSMAAGVTAQTSGVGTLYIDAGGSIAMAGSASLSTAASMLLRADNDIELGQLAAANVSLQAVSGSIVNAGATLANVTADSLRLQAGQAIGAGAAHLTTDVDTLSALASGNADSGLFLSETSGVSIDSVGVTVSEFMADASIDTLSAAAQSDLVAGNGGHIVLNALNGGITLNDGDADGNAVSAQGSGNIRLSSSESSEAGSADILVLASIQSGSGSISLISADSIEQQAEGDITTGGSGTLDLQAAASILMADGAVSQTTGGNIRYQAEASDIAIGQISTGGTSTGQIAVLAGGNVIDIDGDDGNDITGKDLIIRAGGSIAGADNFLDVSVVNLSTRSEIGATYIQSGSVNVNTDPLSVIVDRVENDGTTLHTGADTLQDLTADQDLYLLATSGNITIGAGTNDTGVTQARNIVLIAKQGDILINTGAGDRGFLAYGNIKIVAEKGSVSINGGADSAGLFAYGNILIQAAEADESTGATISIDARIGTLVNPADVEPVNYGYISLLADDDILLADEALIDVGVAGKSLDLYAANAISMVDGGKLQTRDGNVRLEATTGDITLGEIVTGVAGVTGGQVAVIATAGSILDLSVDSSAAGRDIVARDLLLSAGSVIAAAGNHLDIQVENLSARAGNGSLFINEVDGVSVGLISMNVERVLDTWALAATKPAASQEDLSTQGSNGHIVLLADNGGIVLNGGSDGVAVNANGSGSILIDAQGGGSDLAINADILSTTGHITLKAADSISLAASVDITTSSAGSTSLNAETGSLTMHGTTNITAANSSLRVSADGDITLGNMTATSVSIVSVSGSILNAADSTKNVSATHLRLDAEQAIGAANRHLSTAVGTLSALASGNAAGTPATGLFISEDDSITVASVSVSVSNFNADATTTSVNDASQSDLIAANGGNLVLVSGGSLTGNSSINAGGNLLLDVSGDLNANAAIGSNGGHLSLLATGALTQAAAGDISTSGSGTIDVQAAGISMADGASASTGSGNIRYAASGAQLGTLALGSLSTSGHVSLIGSTISDANGDSLNVSGNQLKLTATDFGAAGNLIETTITTLSANVASLYLNETDDLILGDTAAQTVNRVQNDGSVSDQTDAAQSDLISSGEVVLTLGGNLNDQDANGDSDTDLTASNLKLTVTGGIGSGANHVELSVDTLTASASDLYLSEATALTIGTVQGQSGLSSSGNLVLVSGGSLTGNSTLNAGGNLLLDVSGDLNANAAIGSNGGHLSLLSTGALTQAAAGDISTSGSGTIDVQAAGISMADGASASTGSGNIRYAASGAQLGTLALGSLSTSGHVSLIGSTISDANGDSLNVSGNQLKLTATDFGAAGNLIETTITTLSANVASLYLNETDDLILGDTAAQTVNRVQNDGSVSDQTDAAQSDLISSGEVVLTLGGNLNDQDANGDSDTDLTASNLKLTVTGGIGSGANHVELSVDTLTASASDLYLSEATALTIGTVQGQSGLSSSGNLVLVSGGSLTGNSTLNAGGNLLLDVSGDLNANAAIGSNGGHLSLLSTGALTQAAAGDISTSGSGTIDVQAAGISMADGASASTGSGNIRYAASGAQLGTLALGSLSTSGHVSLIGSTISDANGDSLNVSGNQLKLTATDFGAAGNLIETTITTLSANVASLYLNETDDLILGDTAAQTVNRVQNDGSVSDQTDAAQSDLISSGEVVLTLGGNLNDQDANGDTDTDLTATSLKLNVGNSIGSGANHVELSVDTLTASASDLYLSEATALTIGTVQGQSGLSSSGNLVLVSGGSLTGNSTLNAGGNLLLDVSGDLNANAAIGSNGGHLSLLSTGALTQAAAGDISTSGSGTIDVQAAGISMADGASASTGSGNIRYAASGAQLGTLALGSLSTSGHVSLIGSTISDANGDSLNVSGNQLKLTATDFGAAGNLIETTITTLSANVASLYLNETDDLILGDTAAQTVNRVQNDGSVSDQTDAAQSDLISSGEVVLTIGGNLNDQDANGDTDTDLTATSLKLTVGNSIGSGANHVELSVDTLTASASDLYLSEANALTIGTVQGQSGLASSGNLVLVSGGSLTGNSAFNAGGNLLLDVSGDLNANAAIGSNGGHLSLLSTGALTQAAAGDVSTTGTGTIDVQAAGISMADGASASTGSGNIRYAASGAQLGTLALGSLTTSGHVSLIGSTISDAGAGVSDSLNVSANHLRLTAVTGIGAADNSNALEISVATLTAHATQGSISLLESDGLSIPNSNLTVSVNRVDRNGSTQAVPADASQVGLQASGQTWLNASSGLIELDQRIDAGPDQNVNLTGDSIEIQQPVTGDGGVVNLQPTNPDLIIQIGGDTAGGGTLHLSPDSLNNLDGGFSQIVIGSDANPQIDLIGGTPAAPLVFEDPLVLDVNDSTGEIVLQGSTQAEAITADGPVVVQGPVDLGSTGNIVFQQSVDGQTGQPANQLNLNAGGGDVTFAGEIGGDLPLDGLDIADADDVTFDQAVTLNGDLIIAASGTVTFNGDLILNGGTLTITGADAVVIGNVTFTAASGTDRIVIAADSLTLNGDIDGAGKLTLTPATASHDIHIGSTPVAGALNLSAADFAKLSSFDSLELISEDGDIAMQAGESLTVANAEVEIRAGGDISLGTLNHASGAFDRVVLQSLDGRIVDANGSGAIDLTADEIVLRGLGVAEGSSGDVLEVDADRIVIDVDGGIVFQDVAADGTVRFMVMHEGVLYTQLINHGTATRGTDAVDPDGDDFVNLVGGGAGLSNLSATLGLFSSSAAIFQVHSAASPMTASYLAGKASVGSDENDLALWIGDQDLLTDEYGIDPDMLGEDILSATAFSTGQSGDENFYSEYWVESLSL
jgi:hypothetical protein